MFFFEPRSKISLIKWDPQSCQAAAEILAQAKVAWSSCFFFSRGGWIFFGKDSTLNFWDLFFWGVAFVLGFGLLGRVQSHGF